MGGAVTEDKSERVGERDGCDGEREEVREGLGRKGKVQ